MSLNKANLKLLASAGGFNLWLYDTADAAADVDSAGYFNGVAGMMNIGDVIIRRTGTLVTGGGLSAVTTVGFHYVNANDGSTVDIADTLAVTATDTD